MKQYEFIVTYFDFACIEKCHRFDDARSAINFISTLPSNTIGSFFCFGVNYDSVYSFDTSKEEYYNTLLENVIEFLTYDLGGF